MNLEPQNLNHFPYVQINEAFAAQYLACEKALEIDPTKANLDGGAIAIGHPTGAKYIKPSTLNPTPDQIRPDHEKASYSASSIQKDEYIPT